MLPTGYISCRLGRAGGRHPSVMTNIMVHYQECSLDLTAVSVFWNILVSFRSHFGLEGWISQARLGRGVWKNGMSHLRSKKISTQRLKQSLCTAATVKQMV